VKSDATLIISKPEEQIYNAKVNDDFPDIIGDVSPSLAEALRELKREDERARNLKIADPATEELIR
jgi:hypothetical protein